MSIDVSQLPAAWTFETRPGIAATRLDRPGEPLSLEALADPAAITPLITNAGMGYNIASGKAAMFGQCAKALIAAGHSPRSAVHAVFVPGRIELLGKHTDYCGGRSLLCTVERGFCLVAVAGDSSLVRLRAIDLGEESQFDLRPTLSPTTGHWSNYPMTVARRIALDFSGKLCGGDIAFASDLPPAAGLSSSSAFIIGMFLLFDAINHLAGRAEYQANIHSREDLAQYLGCHENGSAFGTLLGDGRGVGTFGGSQDHTAILCCKPGCLSVYRFAPVVHERDVPFRDDVTLLVAGSGVVAEKTGSALALYNAVAARARKIVALWNESTGQQKPTLNSIVSQPADLSALQAILRAKAALDQELNLSLRLEQFLAESHGFVGRAADAFASGDWNDVGAVVDQSHRFAETHLFNQVPKTIALQRGLRSQGALAASAFGAGFGGSVWGLVPRSAGEPRL